MRPLNESGAEPGSHHAEKELTQATNHEVAAESTPSKSSLQTRRGNEFSEAKRAKRLQAVSADAPGKLSLFRSVYAGKASPRQCIKAFCLEWVWLDEAAIRECTATACPLHRLRPYQRREGCCKQVK